MKKLLFSTVICTRNRPSELERCLESIARQVYLPYEVLVVDSSDDDTSKAVVERWQGETALSVYYITTRPGLTKQRNVGIRHSSGDVIAFLDDDVILDENYFESMARCFGQCDEIGGATGFLTNLERRSKVTTAIRRFFMQTGSARKGVMKRSGFADFVAPDSAEGIHMTEILSGCNMLYRRRILDRYSFDEAFEGYSLMEDVEFSHRVSKQYRLVYVKDARLVHERSQMERIDLEKFFQMAVFNHYYIFKKNVRESCLDWIFFWWSDLGLAVKCLYWTLKVRNGKAARGFLSGHLRMLKNSRLASEQIQRAAHSDHETGGVDTKPFYSGRSS